MGADVVIDYRARDFAAELSGYDLVLDPLGGDNLLRSLRVLRRGGKAVGISGPPTPEYARQAGLNPLLRLAVRALSHRTHALARSLGVSYDFLLMRASGEQLRRVAELVDSGAIRPVVGATFRFDQTAEALASLSANGIRGKAVIDMGGRPS
nr:MULTISPECIES: zinc-binding dehydrogenase [unclassified Actinomyces]